MFTDEMTDAYNGQTNHTLLARDADGRAIGGIDYTVFRGQPSIAHIEVRPELRRQGIATKMMDELRKKFPDLEIDPGGFATEDGAAFLRARGGQGRARTFREYVK